MATVGWNDWPLQSNGYIDSKHWKATNITGEICENKNWLQKLARYGHSTSASGNVSCWTFPANCLSTSIASTVQSSVQLFAFPWLCGVPTIAGNSSFSRRSCRAAASYVALTAHAVSKTVGGSADIDSSIRMNCIHILPAGKPYEELCGFWSHVHSSIWLKYCVLPGFEQYQICFVVASAVCSMRMRKFPRCQQRFDFVSTPASNGSKKMKK